MRLVHAAARRPHRGAAQARAGCGGAFGQVLAISGLWLNGGPAAADAPVSEVDEVAVVPPVSGGC